MSDMKCPICGEKIEHIEDGWCNCKNRCLGSGSISLWQALINERQHATDCQDLFIEAIAQKLEIEKELADTNKKLDIAMDLLEIMNDGLPNGNRWKWEIEKTLDQIKQIGE